MTVDIPFGLSPRSAPLSTLSPEGDFIQSQDFHSHLCSHGSHILSSYLSCKCQSHISRVSRVSTDTSSLTWDSWLSSNHNFLHLPHLSKCHHHTPDNRGKTSASLRDCPLFYTSVDFYHHTYNDPFKLSLLGRARSLQNRLSFHPCPPLSILHIWVNF